MKIKLHTEDCLDANDDTSVLKGKCICPNPDVLDLLEYASCQACGSKIIVYTVTAKAVRALKSHEALLEAAKCLIDDLNTNGGRTSLNHVADLEAAIKFAEKI